MTAHTQEQANPAPAGDGADLLTALDQIFAETAALFQRLRAVAPLMHAHDELGEDECTALQSLARDGSRSVTEIGNDCDIPRNQVQKLVKALEKQDLVQMVDNPENKRTKLVELTDSGREVVRSLERREIELLSSLPLAATPADLRSAATALAAVRQALGDEEWRKQLGNGTG